MKRKLNVDKLHNYSDFFYFLCKTAEALIKENDLDDLILEIGLFRGKTKDLEDNYSYFLKDLQRQNFDDLNRANNDSIVSCIVTMINTLCLILSKLNFSQAESQLSKVKTNIQQQYYQKPEIEDPIELDYALRQINHLAKELRSELMSNDVKNIVKEIHLEEDPETALDSFGEILANSLRMMSEILSCLRHKEISTTGFETAIRQECQLAKNRYELENHKRDMSIRWLEDNDEEVTEKSVADFLSGKYL